MRRLAFALCLAAFPAAALAEAPAAANAEVHPAGTIEAWLRKAPPVDLTADAAPGVISGAGEAGKIEPRANEPGLPANSAQAELGRRRLEGRLDAEGGSSGRSDIHGALAIPVGEETVRLGLSKWDNSPSVVGVGLGSLGLALQLPR